MNVLCLGWYGSSNIGDEAFKPAIKRVLGIDIHVDFTNYVRDLKGYDALVIGGGSFLDQPLSIVDELINTDIPIIFLGVGIHGKVHQSNKAWLEKAKLIVCRNRVGVEAFQDSRIIYAPDLVFATLAPLMSGPFGKRLLILPNGFAVPKPNSPDWHAEAWLRFEEVMGPILDDYLSQGWTISIQPMAADPTKLYHYDDRQASYRLAQTTTKPHQLIIGTHPIRESQLLAEIAKANLVLSSRFHGLVFSTAMHTPFVGISSHDKMKSFFIDNNWKNYVDYYKFTKIDLDKAIQSIPSIGEFIQLYERGYIRWQEVSAIIQGILLS